MLKERGRYNHDIGDQYGAEHQWFWKQYRGDSVFWQKKTMEFTYLLLPPPSSPLL